MCSELIAAMPRQTIPFLVVDRRRAILGQPFDEPGRPGAGARLQADIGQDLVGPLVGDGLGFQECRQLGLDQITFGLLVEKDPIGEEFVVSLNLRVDLFVGPEVALGGEDDRDQGELGVVDREPVAAKGFDQPLVEVVEQTAAILRKRQGRLVEDQVMARSSRGGIRRTGLFVARFPVDRR